MNGPRDLRWVWIAGALVVTAASQLCTQLVLARLLGAAEFSTVAALLSLMNFVGVPIVAAQLATTAVVARGGSARPAAVRYLAWGALWGAVALATAPLWSAALALGAVAACQIAAAFVPASFLVSVARGNTVGQGRSLALAGAMAATALLRVTTTIAGGSAWGAPGAVAGAVVSELVLGLVLLALVRFRERPGAAEVPLRSMSATYAQVSMWLIVNVDLLWARRLLEPEDAGRYLLVGGVTVGFVSFGQAYLWHASSTATDEDAGMGIVWRSAAVVAATAALGAPLAAAVLPRLLGPGFDDLGPLLAVGVVWSVCASVVFTSTSTQVIARSASLRRVAPTAVVATALPPLAVAGFGATPLVLGCTAAVSAALGAAVVAGPQWWRRRQRAAASAVVADRIEVVAAP